MRRLDALAGGLAVVLTLSGCASMTDRQWGACAIGGAIIGGTAGGIAGGVALNNTGSPSDGERAGTIIGTTLVGAGIGALIGHHVCDPEREAAPPPPALAPLAALH